MSSSIDPKAPSSLQQFMTGAGNVSTAVKRAFTESATNVVRNMMSPTSSPTVALGVGVLATTTVISVAFPPAVLGLVAGGITGLAISTAIKTPELYEIITQTGCTSSKEVAQIQQAIRNAQQAAGPKHAKAAKQMVLDAAKQARSPEEKVKAAEEEIKNLAKVFDGLNSTQKGTVFSELEKAGASGHKVLEHAANLSGSMLTNNFAKIQFIEKACKAVQEAGPERAETAIKTITTVIQEAGAESVKTARGKAVLEVSLVVAPTVEEAIAKATGGEQALRTIDAITQQTGCTVEQAAHAARGTPVITTMSSDALYEEHTSASLQSFGLVKSTTYHSAAVRKQGNTGEYTSDFAAHVQLPDHTQIGAICDGLGHFRNASSASKQISQMAMVLAQQPQYRITSQDTQQEAEKKLKEMTAALKQYKIVEEPGWERGIEATTALLFYAVIPTSDGKKRLVGINIGDSSMLVYHRTNKSLTLLSEPQQNCRLDLQGAAWTPPYLPATAAAKQNEWGLAQEADMRIFDLVLENDAVIIPSSDGLLDSVRLEGDDQNPTLKAVQTAKAHYLKALESRAPRFQTQQAVQPVPAATDQELSTLLSGVRTAEKALFEAKTRALEAAFTSTKPVPTEPIAIARTLFAIADNNIEAVRVLELERDRLTTEFNTLSEQRRTHLQAVGKTYREQNPQASDQEITDAKDNDEKGTQLKKSMGEIQEKITKKSEEIQKYSYQERDDTTIGAFV